MANSQPRHHRQRRLDAVICTRPGAGRTPRRTVRIGRNSLDPSLGHPARSARRRPGRRARRCETWRPRGAPFTDRRFDCSRSGKSSTWSSARQTPARRMTGASCRRTGAGRRVEEQFSLLRFSHQRQGRVNVAVANEERVRILRMDLHGTSAGHPEPNSEAGDTRKRTVPQRLWSGLGELLSRHGHHRETA